MNSCSYLSESECSAGSLACWTTFRTQEEWRRDVGMDGGRGRRRGEEIGCLRIQKILMLWASSEQQLTQLSRSYLCLLYVFSTVFWRVGKNHITALTVPFLVNQFLIYFKQKLEELSFGELWASSQTHKTSLTWLFNKNMTKGSET